MKREIFYQGRTVGTAEIKNQGNELYVDAKCRLEQPQVLRLFADTVRIGVLEPEDGVWVCRRRLSKQLLQSQGVDMERAVLTLSEGTEAVPNTAPAPEESCDRDALLDRAVAAGKVRRIERDDGSICYSCPFGDGENPLAFALTACCVQDGWSVLNWLEKRA